MYDSKYGVTCHWCRQKTLEEHVTCTHPDCGGGKRLPVSFWSVKNRLGCGLAWLRRRLAWACMACMGLHGCHDGLAGCAARPMWGAKRLPVSFS